MSFDPTLRAQVQAFSPKQGVEASFVEAQRQHGGFEGQKVQELDVRSLLTDAAEEAGFALSEKVEKKLSERRAGSKEHLRASATELAERYVNLMADSQSGRKLHEFAEALKARSEAATDTDIRQFVAEQFKDPSDQFAALSYAEELLTQEGGREELLAAVQTAKASLLREAGAAIRSGLNVAADAIAFARAGLEGADALRDLYRFTVLGGQTVAAIYTAIMDRYGSAKFDQSLEFLLRAAGSDLDGRVTGSSLEATQLKAAVDDIFHVQALGNLHRSLHSLLEDTRRLFGQAA